MATSSRSMRSSRLSTPLSAPSRDAVSLRNEEPVTNSAAGPAPAWEEPPLRPPAPSFEDHRGGERGGTMEYFQPLGTFPSKRVQQRLKAYDPPRRSSNVRNGDRAAARASTEDMSTPDPAPPPSSRRSRSRKVEDEVSRPPSTRVKNEDSEYKPNGLSVTTPSKAASSQSSQYGTPSSRASMGNGKLKEVVEFAVIKSNQNGDFSLGLAIRKLYNDSVEDPGLVALLHAVLGQKATPQQYTAFQTYMKRARKEAKAESKSSKHTDQTERPSSEAKSMSPLHNLRNTTAKAKDAADDAASSENFDSKDLASNTQSPSKADRNNTKSFSSDTSSVNQRPPPTRAKRSSSTSSLSSVASSLSSVDPNLAMKSKEDFAASHASLPPSAATKKGSRAKVSAGPKIGTFNNSNKRPLATIQLSKEDEEFEAKKRKLTKTFPDYVVKDSNIRTSIPKAAEDQAARLPSPVVSQQPGQQASRLRNGAERSGAGEEFDDLDSPTTSVQSELLVPPPPFAGSHHRGTTPTNLGRPPKGGKKSARVKMSPLKKRNGVVAGMPRAGGGRNSPIGSNVADGEGVNSDECSACGGTGKLLCCDGCTRSYHFTCVDPPQDKVPDGEWFCHSCASQPMPVLDRGVFVKPKHSLEKKKPVAFNLPFAIQDYYEDVVRGDDGEYEETTAPSKAKTRGGYDVPTDTLRLRDSKDNLILCFKCNKSAMGNKEIVDCDFCSLHWHLDCLDPPLASAPKRFGRGTWKCPCHVDSEITIPRSASGKSYKVRRPKNPRIVTSDLKRGIKNNGHIDIEDDEISEEEEQPEGTIYRISASAIKLDFISRINEMRAAADQKRKQEDETRKRKHEKEMKKAGKRRKLDHDDGATKWTVIPDASSGGPNDLFEGRTSADCQAALALMQFAQSNPNPPTSGYRVGQVSSSSTAGNPTNVTVNGHSAPNTSNPTAPTESSPTGTKIAAANQGAHSANQAISVQMTPGLSEASSHLATPDELTECLRLEEALKAKIAALRTGTSTATATATTTDTATIITTATASTEVPSYIN